MPSRFAILISVGCAVAARPDGIAAPLRDLDPVEIEGRDLPQLIGQDPSEIIGFRFLDGWAQIPIQIDERKTDSLARIRGATGRGEDVVTLIYADAGTLAGSDPDPAFDADDELAFLFADAGDPAPGADPDGVRPGTRIELRITDPQAPLERFAYLFVSDGARAPDAGKEYVSYSFELLSGSTSGTGPNPEDSTIETSRYRQHFSERWVHDGTEIRTGGATGVDLLDRDEFLFAPGVCSRSTDTFSAGGGAFIANRDGPVRAIRSVIGANSGALTQRDWIAYEGRMAVRTYLRVHPIQATWAFYDFAAAAKGMTYRDDLNPEGLAIDGIPDDARTGQLTWQSVTGPQGSLTIAWILETNIEDLTLASYYFDDDTPPWIPCTGDAFLYAASGPATGGIPDTDGGSPNFFVSTRIVYYDAPGISLEDVLGRVAAARSPLHVENRGGGGGAPMRRGDAGADGAIDLADPIFTLEHLFASGSAPPCPKAADANDDGAIDIADPIHILNYIFVFGPPPPSPYPDCGADPTPDGLRCDVYPPCEPSGNP
ncbi:MAG: hypothetical protein JXP34_02810 [Planctomycetes bacterium]|nr:hypothetical protein [Planctomycetota bacterium]